MDYNGFFLKSDSNNFDDIGFVSGPDKTKCRYFDDFDRHSVLCCDNSGTFLHTANMEFSAKAGGDRRERSELLEILLKVVGIGMISQITELVCADSGNKSLGKSLQILTSALILCLSIPILDEMVSLIESLLRMI